MATELEEKNDVNELEHDDGMQEQVVVKKEDEGQSQESGKNDDLKAAVAGLVEAVKEIKTKEPAAAKQLTPDELDEAWEIFKPEKGRANFVKEFFRISDEDATPEKLKAVGELFDYMRDGIARQSIRGARNFIAVEAKKLRDEMKDALDFVSEIKAERVQKAFYSSYPVLDDPKYAKIVTAVSKTLSGKEFDSQEIYFKELAERSAETIKAVLPDFDLSAEKEKPKPAGTTPRLSRTTQGGGGGAGKGATVETKKSSRNDIDELEP